MNPSPHAATTSTVVTRSRSRALQRPRNISRSRQESSSEREENMDSSMEVEPRRRRTSSSTRNNQEDERSLAMSEDPMETSPTRHERDDGDHDTLELHGGLGSEMAVEIINHGGSRRRDSHEGMASEQLQLLRRNPVKLLTHELLATYEGINRKYYETHSQRNDYDDENGDYIIRDGDVIKERYVLHRKPNSSSPLLGKGSFGQVALGKDMKNGREVAVKIVKNHRHWAEQARFEISVLKKLLKVQMQGLPSTEHANVVTLLDSFEFRNHVCMVFELFPLTLYDLIKYTKFNGVSLHLVHKFARNLLGTLEFLSRPEVDIIHCDLKPENVMLVKTDDHRLKVIDFGSSCSSRRQPFTYIQSRYYRSPEVLLHLPYSYPIDTWSLGLILAEMHTGRPVFNGKNECEQMFKISTVLGLPPAHMLLRAGPKSKCKNLFSQTEQGSWQMVFGEKVCEPASLPLRSQIRNRGGLDKENIYNLFLDLLTAMLEIDPAKRITPSVALTHPFVTQDFSSNRMPQDSSPPAAMGRPSSSRGRSTQTEEKQVQTRSGGL